MIKNASAVLAAVLALNQRKHAAELTLDEEMALLDQKEQARKGKPVVQARPTAEQLKEQAMLQKLKLEAETRTERERALATQAETAASKRAVQTPKDYATWKTQVASFDNAVKRGQHTGGMTRQMRDQIQKQIDSHDAQSNADIAASSQTAAAPAPTPGEPGSPEHRQAQAGRSAYHIARGMRLPQRAMRAGHAVAKAVAPVFQRKQPQTGVTSNAPLKPPAAAGAPSQGITSIKKPGQTGAGQA